jgi:hypothetical protein
MDVRGSHPCQCQRRPPGGTSGASSDASADASNASTSGGYYNGMAVFTVAKGDLMYAATISGQQFTYTPRGAS